MEQFCDRNGSTVPLKKENAGEYMTIRMEWLVERFRDSRVYSSKGMKIIHSIYTNFYLAV